MYKEEPFGAATDSCMFVNCFNCQPPCSQTFVMIHCCIHIRIGCCTLSINNLFFNWVLLFWMALHFVFVSLEALHLSYEVELIGTLPKGQSVCPGDVVIFICTIRGSPPTLTNLIFSWRSPEYIGMTELLQFTIFNMVEDIQLSMINEGVVATLTKNTNINGVPVLESKLQIIASKNFTVSTVVCHNWSSQTNASVEFNTQGGL